MRPEIRPNYQPIVSRDRSTGFVFLTRSILTSSEIIRQEDGNTYLVYDAEVSSASCPLWIGQGCILGTTGWMEKPEHRYSRRKWWVLRRSADGPSS